MDFWRFDRTGLDPSTLLVGDYDPRPVFLSFMVASIASYAALEVIEGVGAASTVRARRSWGGTWVDRRLERARLTIARLEGPLPICAWCKKIKAEDGLLAGAGGLHPEPFTSGVRSRDLRDMRAGVLRVPVAAPR